MLCSRITSVLIPVGVSIPLTSYSAEFSRKYEDYRLIRRPGKGIGHNPCPARLRCISHAVEDGRKRSAVDIVSLLETRVFKLTPNTHAWRQIKS